MTSASKIWISAFLIVALINAPAARSSEGGGIQPIPEAKRVFVQSTPLGQSAVGEWYRGTFRILPLQVHHSGPIVPEADRATRRRNLKAITDKSLTNLGSNPLDSFARVGAGLLVFVSFIVHVQIEMQNELMKMTQGRELTFEEKSAIANQTIMYVLDSGKFWSGMGGFVFPQAVATLITSARSALTQGATRASTVRWSTPANSTILIFFSAFFMQLWDDALMMIEDQNDYLMAQRLLTTSASGVWSFANATEENLNARRVLGLVLHNVFVRILANPEMVHQVMVNTLRLQLEQGDLITSLPIVVTSVYQGSKLHKVFGSAAGLGFGLLVSNLIPEWWNDQLTFWLKMQAVEDADYQLVLAFASLENGLESTVLQNPPLARLAKWMYPVPPAPGENTFYDRAIDKPWLRQNLQSRHEIRNRLLTSLFEIISTSLLKADQARMNLYAIDETLGQKDLAIRDELLRMRSQNETALANYSGTLREAKLVALGLYHREGLLFSALPTNFELNEDDFALLQKEYQRIGILNQTLEYLFQKMESETQELSVLYSQTPTLESIQAMMKKPYLTSRAHFAKFALMGFDEEPLYQDILQKVSKGK